MLARKFIISASANTYAYSKLSLNKKRNVEETTVEFVTGERPLVTIREPEFSDGKMQFSPHADFIIHNSFLRQLYEWDLRSKTPKAYQQEFSAFLDIAVYQLFWMLVTLLLKTHAYLVLAYMNQ